MRFSGRVVNGRIEITSEDPLPEGVAVEGELSVIEPPKLTKEEEEELWQSWLEIERGEFTTAEELIDELRSRRSQ
jgi:hypothetical protein